MSFLRPEAVAQINRWREALLGAGSGFIGFWWITGPGCLMALPGTGLLVLGGALIWVGLQRGRFRGAQGGLGTVQVDEGQITYFGPLSGGAVAVQDLTAITLDRSFFPAHWRLEAPGAPPVHIPVNAEGADALFDAFASLPGLRMERMLAALQVKSKTPEILWQRARAGLKTLG